LEIASGSTFNISTYTCTVGGFLDIYGNLAFSASGSPVMNVTGITHWRSGSTSSISNGQINAKNNWYFYTGADAYLDGSTVNFDGSVNQQIYTHDTDSRFGHITINQTGSTSVSLILSSNSAMRVTGNMTVPNGRKFVIGSSRTLTVDGTLALSGTMEMAESSIATIGGEVYFPSTGWLNMNSANFTCNYDGLSIGWLGKLTMNDGSLFSYPNADASIYPGFIADVSGGILRFGQGFNSVHNGTFQLNAGTMEFTGDGNHYILIHEYSYLHNLKVNKPSGQLSLMTDLKVMNNIDIQTGTFDSDNYNITIRGNWTNTGIFLPTSGKVTFNGGNYDQSFTNTNFNILEVNKPLGGLLTMNNTTVTCATYDWTAGGISVSSGGTFTANDLADNSLFGTYAVNNGTMNLHQDAGQYIDFAGDITISNGGVLNIYGGSSTSYWPFYANASLTMSGSSSVLDIKDNGIYIYQHASYSFTSNITGGTIRTTGGLICNRADFTPSAGTFEFYGTVDKTFNQSAGSLYNVKINKELTARNEDDFIQTVPVYDERSGILLSDGTRANTISLASDFTVTNHLTITSGTLDLNGKTLNVNGHFGVYGTLKMTNAADVLNVGTYLTLFEFLSGSTANITHGIINCFGWIYPAAGCNFNLGNNNTVYIKGISGAGLSNHEPSANYGNVVIAKDAGHWACINGVAFEPIVVNGNFTISSDNTFYMQNNTMIVHGNFTDVSSSIITTSVYNGSKDELGSLSSTEPALIKPVRNDYYLEIDSDYTLKGTMMVNNSKTVYVHGAFDIAMTGTLNIDDGSFISDSEAGYNDIWGTLNISEGLYHVETAVAFRSSAVTSISGGTIRSGSSLIIEGNNILQPTAGIVEINRDFASNIDFFNHTGNYFYDLKLTGTSSTMIYDDILVSNDFDLASGGFNLNGNEVTANRNVMLSGILVMTSSSDILNVGNDIYWNSGSDDNITNGAINVSCNWYFNDGTEARLGSGNTVNFVGSEHSTVYCDDDNARFGNLVVNKSGFTKRVVLETAQTFLISEDLVIQEGELYLFENVQLEIGNSLTVEPGGIFRSWANENPCVVTKYGTEPYAFNVEAWGNIASKSTIFEYMDASGVNIKPSAFIDDGSKFWDCTFRNGAAGGTLLTIDNSLEMVLDNVTFVSSSLNALYNVTKNVDNGTIQFTNSSGNFDGPDYENDPYNRIDWVGFTAPAVTTDAITNIGETTATSGGNVTADGGSAVTDRGVCWNTSANPTLADDFTEDGTGTGAFISSLTGLTQNTTYYVRSYATNALGTTYGNEVFFTTTSAAPPAVPQNVTIEIVSGNVVLNWDAVSRSRTITYKIYSSDDPNAAFGTWNFIEEISGTTWTAPISATKKFYRVTAVN
jgi:hypothetical protein